MHTWCKAYTVQSLLNIYFIFSSQRCMLSWQLESMCLIGKKKCAIDVTESHIWVIDSFADLSMKP